MLVSTLLLNRLSRFLAEEISDAHRCSPPQLGKAAPGLGDGFDCDSSPITERPIEIDL